MLRRAGGAGLAPAAQEADELVSRKRRLRADAARRPRPALARRACCARLRAMAAGRMRLSGERTRRNARPVRRRWPVALAILALLLQTLAPLAIAPPRGQPVHYAHSHHGENDPAAEGRAGSAPGDSTACPVCQALQAGGTGIAASAVVLVAADDLAQPVPAPRAEAPVAELPSDHRARAPPIAA